LGKLAVFSRALFKFILFLNIFLKANAVVEVYKKLLHYDLKQHIDPIQYKISIKKALAA
jgi:hypothetical protein